MRASRRYAGRLKKSPPQSTFDAMCLSVELHQKAEDSGGFDRDVSPESEELDLQFNEDTPSRVVSRHKAEGMPQKPNAPPKTSQGPIDLEMSPNKGTI